MNQRRTVSQVAADSQVAHLVYLWHLGSDKRKERLMKRWRYAGVIAAIGLAVLLASVSLDRPSEAQAESGTAIAALAQETDATCIGTLPSGSYINVTVPADTSCVLDETHRIAADLRVETGAQLTATGVYVEANLVSSGCVNATEIRVGGDAELNPTNSVLPCFIEGSTIGANLELRGGPGGFRLEQTNVGGRVRLLDVDPDGIVAVDEVLDSRIGGQLESTNRVGIRVENTWVGGSLVCRDNAFPAVLMGNNVEGQVSCP
jgi:hypothetical protein